MDDATPAYHRPRRSHGNGSTRWPERNDPAARPNVLIVTRGHPFARDPFFEIFESNEAIEWTSVEHPAAQHFFSASMAADFDCFVLYDMPGIEFQPGAAPNFFAPSEEYVAGLMALFDSGFPFVILHHACAAWPAWPEWSEIVGSHFLYQPGQSRGVDMPDSGYVFGVNHTVSPVGDHPITAGIDPFELVDELYLAPVFEDTVDPLFVSDFEFVDANFSSAALALEGRLNERGDWTHPPGSNLVGWTKTYRKSSIVYLQFGDGPSTYANPNFRQVLANAIDWACAQNPSRQSRSAHG